MKLKLLMIGYVWPEKTSSAAGVRSWGLIDAAKKADWDVTFVSPSKENEHAAKIRALGFATALFSANDSNFDSFVRDLNPDVVIFDRFVIEEQFGWRVKEQCPDAVRIIDTQDLHFLRRAREAAFEAGKTLQQIKDCEFSLLTADALRELAAIYRSDGALILSSFEMSLLKNKMGMPKDLLVLSRFWYPQTPAQSPSYSQRKDFVFIGNFRHAPNADAVRWLAQEIWPSICSRLPQAQLHIYGAYPPKEMMNLSNKKIGLDVRGPVADAIETLQAYRVNLAPLRFGAGIKGKITDGWWAGTPTVCTSIAAEGMVSEGARWGGLIADDLERFVEQSVLLHEDESGWVSAHEKGREAMKNFYSEEVLSQQWIEWVLELKKVAPTNRQKNIVGAMLWHHLYKSTTYFSKWIEAKNKPPAAHSG